MQRLPPLAALTLLLFTLTGCFDLSPQPPRARITVSSVNMPGILSTTVAIDASAPWQLESTEPWLSVYPAAGDGDEFVTVTVDEGRLEPGAHQALLRLSEPLSGTFQQTPVYFSFPRLTGRISRVENSDPLLSTSLLAADQALPESSGRLLVGLNRPDADLPGSQSLAVVEEQALSLAVSLPDLTLIDTARNAPLAIYRAGNMRRAAESLRRHPQVRYVEMDRVLERLASNDTYRDRQWSLDTIEVDQAWTLGTGEGIRVAIIDSGFHPGHSDLWPNESGLYNVQYGTSSVHTSPACGTHGEHVAGIVGAVADNAQGIAGVAPDSELIYVDVSSDDGSCSIFLSHLVDALYWLANDTGLPRADVANVSLGSIYYSAALDEAVFAAFSAGVTLVAASGNDPNGPVMYPAAFPDVIAVSATGPSDEAAWYNSTGTQVFISAPGGNPDQFTGLPESAGIYSTVDSTDYDYMSGTSMASPAVAAVAALMLSENATLNPLQIADALAAGSVDLGPIGRDEDYGHGRLNAAAAVLEAQGYDGGAANDTYRLTVEGTDNFLPFHGGFDLGYVAPGNYEVAAVSDDDGDGSYGETGEYAGAETIEVAFGSRDTGFAIEVYPVGTP